MRRLILLAGLALALGVLLPGSALAGPQGSDLPWKASGSGAATLNLLTGQGHIITTGPASQFGVMTFEQSAELFPGFPFGTFPFSADWTATAANGDQMFGRGAGLISTTDGVNFTFASDYASSRGTGRLEGASLTLEASAHGTGVVEGDVVTLEVVQWTAVGQVSW